MIHVLAVLPAGERDEALREMARAEHWTLKRCNGVDEAAGVLRAGPRYQVVVLDSAEWKRDIAEVRSVAPWAAVLVAGAALWKDVVELGGYGVLPKPFSAEQAAKSVLHASWFAASRHQPTPLRTA